LEQDFSSIVNVAAILAAGMLIGMLVGFAFARTGQRRDTEGDRIRERLEFDTLSGDYDNLRGEYDEYRDKVELHFKDTSEAFKQTTEQYRALYQRIATGAVNLCDPEAVKPILASVSAAGNAVSEVATATVSNFPRTQSENADDALGNALADMRSEMNELDQAIDDLKADVIAPTRKDLEQRGVIGKTPANVDAKATAEPDKTKSTAHLRAVKTTTSSPPSTARESTTPAGSSPAAVPAAVTVTDATPNTGTKNTPSTTPDSAGSAAAKVIAKASNGAVNDIKNATRNTKKRLFQSGRIISPGSRKSPPGAAGLKLSPSVAADRLAASPEIRLER